jgi:glycosyltransferase involved in cell wall biosynthesis
MVIGSDIFINRYVETRRHLNAVKVSIISGVYNAEKYLGRCIESMLKQTYKELEIILVVNASIDGSKDIVKKFEEKEPERIKAFYFEEKLGAGGSRQYGMEHASGDFICFVDCDDELEPEYVSQMVEVALTNKEKIADIVVCNFKKVDANGKILYKRIYKNKEQLRVQSVAPWGKMFNTYFLKKNHLVLRNVPFGEDILFSTELYLIEPDIRLCGYLGYIWRDNPQSTSHTELKGFPVYTVESAIEYFDYMKERYADKIKYLNYFRYKYFVWYLLQSGRKVKKADMSKEYDKAFSYLYRADNRWNRINRKMVVHLKGERPIVTGVLFVIRIFERLHLSRTFFTFYSQSCLGRFWPSL